MKKIITLIIIGVLAVSDLIAQPNAVASSHERQLYNEAKTAINNGNIMDQGLEK